MKKQITLFSLILLTLAPVTGFARHSDGPDDVERYIQDYETGKADGYADAHGDPDPHTAEHEIASREAYDCGYNEGHRAGTAKRLEEEKARAENDRAPANRGGQGGTSGSSERGNEGGEGAPAK